MRFRTASQRDANGGTPETVSVVLPCFNEAETVGGVVDEAWAGLKASGYDGEVIVVDNGSTDGSAEIAARQGARIVHEPRRGYGSAYLAGLAEATGDLVVLADADGTYPLNDLGPLLAPLREGAGLVLGSRFQGTMEKDAMPFLNRRLGNPILTWTLNRLFKAKVSDAHSGLRALRRDDVTRLDLQTTGMEFASEMIVKAAKRGLRIEEVPIDYRVRVGESKLSPARDAWRHIRFMLVHSPTHLFLLPGLLFFLVGATALLVLSGGPVGLFGRTWEIHTAIVAAILVLVGGQIVQLGLFARTYAVLYLDEHDDYLERAWNVLRLEHGLAAGAFVLLTGCVLLGTVIVRWAADGFGQLHQEHLSVLAVTLIGLGVQVIFGSFFLSILGLRSSARR